MDKVIIERKEINIKIVKGCLIPGFEEEGIPFFITESDDNRSVNWQEDALEEEKIYCADCGKLVEGYRDILYIDADIRARGENYARKRVCNTCCEEKYTAPSSTSSVIPLNKVISTTLGEVLNTVTRLHSSRTESVNVDVVKKEILDLFFDYFDRPAYIADDGHIYLSILGREGAIDNKHVEGEDFFQKIGAYLPKPFTLKEESYNCRSGFKVE